MGSHICRYCTSDKAESTGDVIMYFTNGYTVVAPDMILHYVDAHGFVPPTELVDAVMNSEIDLEKKFSMADYVNEDLKVGYLSGEIPQDGELPAGFSERLTEMYNTSVNNTCRMGTKGA